MWKRCCEPYTHVAYCAVLVHCSGTRPAPPEGAPDLPLAFQMLNDNLQIFRDVGGGSLHRWVHLFCCSMGCVTEHKFIQATQAGIQPPKDRGMHAKHRA
jgi:hypothetical protein